MRSVCRLALASLLVLALPVRAEAAFGVVPGVAGLFPVEAVAPDVMVGGTAFYEVLPWLVARVGAYTGSYNQGALWHFPVSLGYVLPQGGDFQLRPRLELGLDPYWNPANSALSGTNWHVGIGLDYLPFDNHWVIGTNLGLIWGVMTPVAYQGGQAPPVIGPWLARLELGIGYKF